MASKEEVRDFWNAAACGEELYLASADAAGYQEQYTLRYALEEEAIAPFFKDVRGKQVLEIGLGLGADHQRLAMGGAILTGVDISPRAIEHVRRRSDLMGINSTLAEGDAENLKFPDNSFDIVFSWGVIHHTPDTAKAAREILRVLKPGGEFRVMIYSKYSVVGFMLWARYGALQGKSLSRVYSEHLESPGTKAYTPADARELFAGAENVRADTVLTHADLLSSQAGQRHTGRMLSIMRVVWPRWFIRKFLPSAGLYLRITGKKLLRAD